MKPITREPLSAKSLSFLKKNRTNKVLAKTSHTEQVNEAKRLWGIKANKAFSEIQERLARMAPGRSRCMYCEDSAGTDIEHFWPKATYPQKAYEWSNYLWACSHYNSNAKRNLFPLDHNGFPTLIDPTAENPRHHLTFLPSNGEFQAETLKGSTSINIFGLNNKKAPQNLPKGRKHAFISLRALIVEYAQERAKNNLPEAELRRRVICDAPFASLLHWILVIHQGPLASVYLTAACIQALNSHPEISNWL